MHKYYLHCFDTGLHAGSVGGGSGDYYSNPGEVVIWRRCPRDFGFYVMDDDVSAGVMQALVWIYGPFVICLGRRNP